MTDEDAATRGRMPLPAVLLIVAVAGLVPLAAVILRLVAGVDLNLLFDDLAESSGIPTWYGAVSMVGVIAWITGGAIAGFAAWTGLGGRQASRSLAWAGVLSVFLGLDDLFRFHEHLSNVSELNEALFLGIYLIAAALWVHRHRWALDHEMPLLLVAVAGFGTSLVLDVAAEVGAEGLPGVYLLEDAAKVVGVLCWAAALALGSRRIITATITPTRSSPGALTSRRRRRG